MVRFVKLLVLGTVLVGAVVPAVAATEGSPIVSVHLPDNRAVPGEDSTVELFLLNGQNITDPGPAAEEAQVTTARNVTVSLAAGGAPIEVETATRPVGTVPEGRTGPIPFAISVDAGAAPGEYAVPVTVSYNFTHRVDTSDPDDPIRETTTRTIERTVTIVIEERARFDAVSATTDGAIGEAGTVSIALENVGTAAASNARVILQSPDPALTFGPSQTASVFVGDWTPGTVKRIAVSGTFATTTNNRSIPIVATVDFDADGEAYTSDPLEIGVTPAAEPGRFPVVNTTADLAVGERGSVTVSLRNAGEAAVSDAMVTVRSADAVLSFGDAPTAAAFVGEWAPGDVRTVTLPARLPSRAAVRPYPLSVSVDYRSADGERHESRTARTGVTPRTEQSFRLANVTSSLAVGDEGQLEATLTNTGPNPVRNAVVIFEAESANMVPVETEYALGDLGPGESATVSFDAEVSESADAGPRQTSFVVRYRDREDDVRRSDPLDAQFEVQPRQDVFAIDPVTRSLRAGESGVFELRVTNDGTAPVSDVSAKLFADDPLSSDDDEAFIDQLAPGESVTVRFALAIAPTALEKVYPVSLDFQYEDAEGDTRLSDTYDAPVRVAISEDDGVSTSLAIGGAAVAVVFVVVGVVWAWRRR